MSVRKRTWVSAGQEQVRWVVDYTDQAGARHHETYNTKAEAKQRHSEIDVDMGKGVHVAASKSPTVAVAGKAWLKAAGSASLERATIEQYRQHLNQHIVPFIGGMKLADIGVPTVRKFQERLEDDGRSPAMVKKIIVSLGGIFANAVELRHSREPGREF